MSYGTSFLRESSSSTAAVEHNVVVDIGHHAVHILARPHSVYAFKTQAASRPHRAPPSKIAEESRPPGRTRRRRTSLRGAGVMASPPAADSGGGAVGLLLRRRSGQEARWAEEARFAGTHELGMCLRWGLSRVLRVEGGRRCGGCQVGRGMRRKQEEAVRLLLQDHNFTQVGREVNSLHHLAPPQNDFIDIKEEVLRDMVGPFLLPVFNIDGNKLEGNLFFRLEPLRRAGSSSKAIPQLELAAYGTSRAGVEKVKTRTEGGYPIVQDSERASEGTFGAGARTTDRITRDTK
ncbi:hypothetical protein DFH09DRAFT_1281959 [Mycena vulgaris]|nr:hypothetical protein DFH09DRAFT_1281959 [Mycena vulgaris]